MSVSSLTWYFMSFSNDERDPVWTGLDRKIPKMNSINPNKWEMKLAIPISWFHHIKRPEMILKTIQYCPKCWLEDSSEQMSIEIDLETTWMAMMIMQRYVRFLSAHERWAISVCEIDGNKNKREESVCYYYCLMQKPNKSCIHIELHVSKK